MIDFEIYRNSELISTAKGLKNSYQGKVFINFFPDVDVHKNSMGTLLYYSDSIDM